MNPGPSDTWLTHDAAAEEIDAYCETCGEDLTISVDPEGSTVYCPNCKSTRNEQKRSDHKLS